MVFSTIHFLAASLAYLWGDASVKRLSFGALSLENTAPDKVDSGDDDDPDQQFVEAVDAALCATNEDYEAHRIGDFGMRSPVVIAAPPGSFAPWMKSRGQLGGQHKVPRIINDDELFAGLRRFVSAQV